MRGGSAYLGLKCQALNKRDFNLYFMRAFTLVLICPIAKEMHVDIMLNHRQMFDHVTRIIAVYHCNFAVFTGHFVRAFI